MCTCLTPPTHTRPHRLTGVQASKVLIKIELDTNQKLKSLNLLYHVQMDNSLDNLVFTFPLKLLFDMWWSDYPIIHWPLTPGQELGQALITFLQFVYKSQLSHSFNIHIIINHEKWKIEKIKDQWCWWEVSYRDAVGTLVVQYIILTYS